MSNECFRHLPIKHLYIWHNPLTTAFGCPIFQSLGKKQKIIALPKNGKDTNFPQNACQISFLSATGNLFEKVILKVVQRHIIEKGLFNASLFGFRL
jgi:hypothetical protein